MKCGRCDVVVPIDDDFGRRWFNHERSHLDPIVDIRAAANALADARVRFAQEFGRLKILNPQMTDKAAIYAATETTNDEVTRLEAELEIARRTA